MTLFRGTPQEAAHSVGEASSVCLVDVLHICPLDDDDGDDVDGVGDGDANANGDSEYDDDCSDDV